MTEYLRRNHAPTGISTPAIDMMMPGLDGMEELFGVDPMVIDPKGYRGVQDIARAFCEAPGWHPYIFATTGNFCDTKDQAQEVWDAELSGTDEGPAGESQFAYTRSRKSKAFRAISAWGIGEVAMAVDSTSRFAWLHPCPEKDPDWGQLWDAEMRITYNKTKQNIWNNHDNLWIPALAMGGFCDSSGSAGPISLSEKLRCSQEWREDLSESAFYGLESLRRNESIIGRRIWWAYITEAVMPNGTVWDASANNQWDKPVGQMTMRKLMSEGWRVQNAIVVEGTIVGPGSSRHFDSECKPEKGLSASTNPAETVYSVTYRLGDLTIWDQGFWPGGQETRSAALYQAVPRAAVEGSLAPPLHSAPIRHAMVDTSAMMAAAVKEWRIALAAANKAEFDLKRG